MRQDFNRSSFTLAAGIEIDLYTYGRYLTLLGLTGSPTIDIALDEGEYVSWRAGISYELPGNEILRKIRVRNSAAVPVTVEISVSLGRIWLIQDSPSTMVLSNILTLLTGVTTAAAVIPEATIGVAAGQITAAAATARRVTITSHPANTGLIYLGFSNAVAVNAWATVLLPGGSHTFDSILQAVWGISDVAAQRVGGCVE